MEDKQSLSMEKEAYNHDTMTTDDKSLLLSADSTQVQITESFESLQNSLCFDQNTNALIVVQRSAYDQPAFDAEFEKEDAASGTFQRLKSSLSSRCLCSWECVRQRVLGLFPCVSIMRGYLWKEWFACDITAGLCVAVLNIPQSMGYAMMASLPPVYGLYASLFPILFYFIFGTSRHISMGTIGIVSLLVGNVVIREAAGFIPAQHGNTTNTTGLYQEMQSTTYLIDGPTDHPELVQYKVKVALSVSFLVGLIQIAMSFLKLGILADFMSLPFIGGFLAGAALHIITSQVPFCLGVTVPRHTGLFHLVWQWVGIVQVICESSMAEVTITLSCMLALVVMKELINERYRHRLKVPIPAELLVVGVVILVSYLAQLSSRFHVRVLGHIPTGIPPPEVPVLGQAPDFILNALVIAIVSFVLNMSLTKFFSEKYRYPIDRDQEMLAYGLAHTFSAFFSSIAGAQAPARTMVQDSSGGKTQVASLISALLILLVCLYLAPLFEYLPTSALGSIIIVALFPLFKCCRHLCHLWRVNRLDFFVWVGSFWAVVLLDIDVGLVVGIGLSLATLVLETVRVPGYRLALAPRTELFAASDLYKGLSDMSSSGMFIFRAPSPLFFANTESLKDRLFKDTIDPRQAVLKKATDRDTVPRSIIRDVPAGNVGDTEDTGRSAAAHPVIVLDCSSISYIDLAGLELMTHLRRLYEQAGVRLVLAHCNPGMQDKLGRHGENLSGFVYPSIVDAVVRTRGTHEA